MKKTLAILLSAAMMLGLLAGCGSSDVFNLGNGAGYSVREIIETARRITGKEIKAVVESRRGGDPSVLIASNKKAAASAGRDSPSTAEGTVLRPTRGRTASTAETRASTRNCGNLPARKTRSPSPTPLPTVRRVFPVLSGWRSPIA